MRAAIVAAFVVVVLVECVLCNVPFFPALAASGDSAAAYNTLGPGLERRDDGLLEVIDPTQAYLQVAADGSSDYVRVVPVSDEVLQGAEQQGERVLRTVRVRPDADRRACELTSVSLDSSRSLYVRAAAGRTVRVQVWNQGLGPFEAVRANVACAFFGESAACGVVGVGAGVGGVVAPWFRVCGRCRWIRRVCVSAWRWVCCWRFRGGDRRGGGMAVGVCRTVELSYGWHVYV